MAGKTVSRKKGGEWNFSRKKAQKEEGENPNS
jgi:hypothetical protein